MFCPYCGAEVKDGARFCVTCGNPVQSQPAQTMYAGNEGLIRPELPMKWYKFVINFSLWAGALLNIGNGIMALMGM